MFILKIKNSTQLDCADERQLCDSKKLKQILSHDWLQNTLLLSNYLSSIKSYLK